MLMTQPVQRNKPQSETWHLAVHIYPIRSDPSLHLCIHQSFVSCQLVDGPKLHYQTLIDVHHIHKQPNAVAPKLHAFINEQIQTKKYHQPAAENLHEAYLPERTYLDPFIYIFPIDL